MIPVDVRYLIIPGARCTEEENSWLAQQTALMSEKEKLLFTGAMRLKRPRTIAEVIDMANQLNCFEAIYPAGNRRELGRFVAKYMKDEYGEFAHLPKQDVGAAYEKGRTGIYVPVNTCESRGAYVTQELTLRQLYDGTNLKDLPEKDYRVRIRLTSPDCPSGVWVKLPDYSGVNEGYPDEIAIALDSLDAVSLEDCTLAEVQCALPGLEAIASQYDAESLEKLIRDGNNMGFVLEEQWQGRPYAQEHFLAALEYECCTRLDLALDISQNLNCYDFVPPGEGQAGAGGKSEMQITQHGCIRRNNQEFFYDHSQPPQGPELSL